MAYVFQTTDEINEIIATMVQNITGFAADKVLFQHPENGQPFQKIDENVIYVETYIEQDVRNTFKNRSDKYNSEDQTITRTQQSTRTLIEHIIMYGPTCDSVTCKINESVYMTSFKDYLNANHLFLIPDRTEYNGKMFEKLGSRWWTRGDLKLYFSNTVSIDETIATIQDVDYTIKEEN